MGLDVLELTYKPFCLVNYLPLSFTSNKKLISCTLPTYQCRKFKDICI